MRQYGSQSIPRLHEPADFFLTRDLLVATMRPRNGLLNPVIEINGRWYPVGTRTCNLAAAGDNLITAAGADSGAPPVQNTAYYLYASSSLATFAADGLRASATAPTTGYLGLVGNAREWRHVGWVARLVHTVGVTAPHTPQINVFDAIHRTGIETCCAQAANLVNTVVGGWEVIMGMNFLIPPRSQVRVYGQATTSPVGAAGGTTAMWIPPTGAPGTLVMWDAIIPAGWNDAVAAAPHTLMYQALWDYRADVPLVQLFEVNLSTTIAGIGGTNYQGTRAFIRMEM